MDKENIYNLLKEKNVINLFDIHKFNFSNNEI